MLSTITIRVAGIPKNLYNLLFFCQIENVYIIEPVAYSSVNGPLKVQVIAIAHIPYTNAKIATSFLVILSLFPFIFSSIINIISLRIEIEHIAELVYAPKSKNAIIFKKLEVKLNAYISLLLFTQYVKDRNKYTKIITICDAMYVGVNSTTFLLCYIFVFHNPCLLQYAYIVESFIYGNLVSVACSGYNLTLVVLLSVT